MCRPWCTTSRRESQEPLHTVTFLGILLDTNRMEIRLPNDKLQRIRTELASWLQKESATKQEILGLLQHATKVVKSSRTFVAQMYQSAAKLKKLKYFTRLTQSFRSDLYWWHTFIVNWNGLCIWRKPDHTNHVFSPMHLDPGVMVRDPPIMLIILPIMLCCTAQKFTYHA